MYKYVVGELNSKTSQGNKSSNTNNLENKK